jgi:site-specific recombinase XerD
VKFNMTKSDTVNWEDPVLKRWLGTITKLGTKKAYKSAFRVYTVYTGLTPSQLIDEAIADSKRDPREKQDVLKTRILGFYGWLKKDYEKKSRGKGEHRIAGKGVSDYLASMMVSVARSFYQTYDLTVVLKGRQRLPKPRTENKRMIVGAEQVKVLVDHARTPRDRAIILTHFQGGLDVSTLCSLRYKNVAEGLAKNEYPLKLDLQRPKTGVAFYTFIGKDAIEALKAYLADLKGRGITLAPNDPLFLQDRGRKGVRTNNVQDMLREVALKSGFIDKANNGNSFNPLGPHALRESFGSIMTNSGVPDSVVDFWLGHEVGALNEAYKSVQFESLKQMYLAREKLVSIFTPKIDVEELREKLRGEMEQQNKQLQVLVNSLVSENIELKGRIQVVEGRFASMEKIISQMREAVSSLEKHE